MSLFEVLLLLASFHMWKLRSEKLRKFLKRAEPVSGRAGICSRKPVFCALVPAEYPGRSTVPGPVRLIVGAQYVFRGCLNTESGKIMAFTLVVCGGCMGSVTLSHGLSAEPSRVWILPSASVAS